MLASFLLAFREGLEAALLISVLIGALKKMDRTKYQSSVWYGAAIAFVLSIAIGYGMNLLGASFEGRAEEIFEGVAMILAAIILTWVILWMQKQAQQKKSQLETGVQEAVIKDSRWALFSIAFLAVIREGVELSFFLTAAAVETDSSQILIGAILGLVTVALGSILLFKSLIKLNISAFFRVTSVILILFAAGLVAHGVHEFNEVGYIPSVIENIWDMNHIIDEKSTVGQFLKTLIGYNGNPSLTEVIAYVLYYVILWFSLRTIKQKNK